MSSIKVIGITPFQRPDPRLALALERAGASGVLDLGRDRRRGLAALAELVRMRARLGPCDARGVLGVRVASGAPFQPSDLPREIGLVLLDGAGTDPDPWRGPGARAVWAEVVSTAEARDAVARGYDALVAGGNERGGRVGQDSTFVLLQRLLTAVELPVYAHGGLGPRTAAACAAGGAAGIVLDEQLALVRESRVPDALRLVLAGLDGSETALLAGRRVLARPGLAPLERLAGASPAEVDANLGGDDPARRLIPLGQAAFLARPLSEQHGSAAGVVEAVRRAVRERLELARRHDVLGPDSPLAREHGTRYPILQGPMTRVSDVAGFADDVAAGGGLPFLALALLRGKEVRELVRETAARLGERSWGIGILGFVPPELRAEQMAALEEVAPPFAIIAGGRPSQAKGLEERGTKAYLHVPSQGLLELFLKEGGRRFVFEGRECGGHVGPRGSFPLWEAQLAVLERFEKPEELSVVFAGGIHDARSAAMVAALAARLAARGARVGVLMGTAYLFTREAVSSGAILPAYQRMALECRETALLETAPGHATRCVETEFVRAFAAEKLRLEAQGLESREVWAALEQLNLGRLRLASKGKRRDGAKLVDIGEAEQVREGMYMIGQVASMRSSVTTVEELHREVSLGSVRRIAELAPAAPAPEEPEAAPVDIAIVGMACVFAGAEDLEGYWANVVGGVDSVREVPSTRWSSDLYYDRDGAPGRKTPSKWGGFIDPIVFDPSRFGIPPKSLTSIEAVQLLSLEVARRALVDAGYASREFRRDRTAVVFGAEAGTELAGGYGFRAMFPQVLGDLPKGLEESLPVLTEDSFPGVLANVIAGRIANRLDLGGMNFTVDAACASSLAAVEVAVQSLVNGTSDMVVAGGADTHNSINDYLLFSSVHALSKQGRCRSFDGAADGITLGEGVGAVVLKRLADAERDGDRIYAVIKGLAGSSDGKSLGLTAPRKEGQMRALERAWRQSGLDPVRAGLMEAHGTGTVVGDRTELESMTSVFERARPGSCALGSVKSQIGHTKCAAGIASLIKVALCLERGVLPPTLHIDAPNPGWRSDRSPFYFLDRAQPWTQAERVAAVSAFGFGGTNFHAVLASHRGLEEAAPLGRWPVELFLVHGVDRAAARRRLDVLARRIADEHPWDLAALARAACAAGAAEPVQFAFVARDHDDLAAKLASARAAGAGDGPELFVAPDEPRPRPKVAFLFPGQGSQRVGMLAELFVAFPMLRPWLESGLRAAERVYVPRSFSKQESAAREEALKDTRAAQPALGLVDIAMFRVLSALGVEADMLGGHSYGELAALCAAEAIRPEDLLTLSQRRAEEILRAAGDDPGGMAAVSSSAEDVERALEGEADIVLANLNAPRQTVISGPTPALERALERLAQAGLAARRIPVACAFHSGVVAAAEEGFGHVLDRVAIEPPEKPVFSNRTARAYPHEASEVRRLLREQVAHPVLFTRQVEAMYAAGARVFVEVGPGRVLTGLVQKILAERDVAVVSTDAPGAHGLVELATALARLAALGVPVDARALFAERDVERFDLDRDEPRKLPPLAWWLDGHRAWPARGELPAGAMRPMTEPDPAVLAELAGRSGGPVAVPQAGEREASVVEYLRNLREIAEAQRQVMLSMLGTPVPAAPAAYELPARAPAAMTNGPAPTASNGRAPAPNGTVAPASGGAAAASGGVQGPRVDVETTLLAIVSERTGYPVEMLGLDLDLEGDLSIDSIKRIEILGALNEALGGMTAGDGDLESVVEELAHRKTLRGILDWLAEHAPAASAAGAAPAVPLASSGGAPGGAANGAAAASAAPAPAPASRVDVQATLLAIVSERTGYPIEMLDLDLDLEGDLSIDSIKRIEILGGLNEALGGLASGDGELESVVEELAHLKTLRAILDWLAAQSGEAPAPAAAPAGPAPVAAAQEDEPEPLAVTRYVLRVSELPEAPINGRSLVGRRVALTDDRLGVSAALGSRLEKLGAELVRVARVEDLGRVDVLIHLATLAPDAGVERVKDLFDLVQRGVKGGASIVMAATGMGGDFGRGAADLRAGAGAGVAGLLRSLKKEHPELHVRAVDLDPREATDALVAHLVHELLATDDEVEVGYRDGTRRKLKVEPAELAEGAGGTIRLDRDSVVLITGGARGITARIALDLAKSHGSTFELVGRSPLPPGPGEPGALDAELAGAADALELKRILARRGAASKPAELEALARRIAAQLEVTRNLEALRAAGARVRYHSLDVRDRAAFGALIDRLYAEHGRLDGVIHGAGVIEDKLLVDKSRVSFDRVFDTKVMGALTLAEKLRPDVSFVVFFSSVSSAFGNRGQTDYAAANDLLDKLACQLDQRLAGRVVSVNWGPWDSAGMVGPELRREYARRGIGLIPLARGSERLLAELAASVRGDSQVILMSAEPEAMT